jgi:soluble lytic murein transglycosylase-like protein
LSTSPIEVARIFGRAQGCSEASPDLIQLVARESVGAGVDPRIFAALIAVESGCNQYAISNRGAIGYTQVLPRVWRTKYDFSNQYNLLNAKDNIHVGATILADLVQNYGLREGVRRYNGLGVDCATCDANYTAKILNLAGRR